MYTVKQVNFTNFAVGKNPRNEIARKIIFLQCLQCSKFQIREIELQRNCH